MNFAGKFNFSHFDSEAPTGSPVEMQANGGGLHGAQPSIVIPDAYLLFAGDYKRAGLDLVLSKDGHDHIVHDYFKSHVRAALSSPDGAQLSGALVESLTGEVQVAQLGGATAAATVIGKVTKLSGSATAIRNGVSIQLNMGDTVNKGDVVQCGSDSSLGLTFIDGTVFGLSSNARMVLNEMVYDPQGSSNSSLLSLVQGTITFVAGETAKNGNMKVDTPVATMGIRGTAVLVEIDFSVPGTGGAPPVKFQVLVEPGGKVGSYVLYSKSDPNVVIGTVNQAGQVTSVTGDGSSSTATAPLSPEALAIIPQIFQLYFPNYTPNANPQGTPPNGGSTPATPTPGGSNPDPIKFTPAPGTPTDLPVGQPTPIRFADNTGHTVDVTITRLNTAPTIVVTPVVVTLPVNNQSFNIADHVTITDPDMIDPTFNDVIVPYVAGTGRVISATGSAPLPAGLDLAGLVRVDPQTGAVSYDAATFKFLGENQRAVFTIEFDSRSGPDTVLETLTFTIDGVNDAPVITDARLAVAEGGTVILTAADFAVTDPDSSSFSFTVSSATHGKFQVSADGINWTDATAFTTAELSASHVRFVHDGGETAPSFSIQVDDGASVNHAGNLISGTVSFNNVNDAPVLTAASLTVAEGATVVLGLANFAVTDPDSASFTFTVSNVVHGQFQTSTDGTSWIGATNFTNAELSASHVRFVHDGGETAPSFSVQVDDGASVNHAGNLINGTVSFSNVNDAPVLISSEVTVSSSGIAFGPNLVTNGGFETDNFSGWTRSGNLGATGVYNFAHSGSYAAHLGPVGSDGFLTEHISTTPGQTYILDFWLAHDGGGTNDFSAHWNGATLLSLSGAPSQNYNHYTYEVTATSGTTGLTFQFRQDPAYWNLDDIQVRADGQAASGTLSFTDAETADTHSATFVPLNVGNGYIGTFSLTGITEAYGAGTFGWNFGVPASAVATLTSVVTQSYDVTIDDHHNGMAVQRVSVSIGTAGSDNFVFRPGVGTDVITNFITTGLSADHLELDGFGFADASSLQALVSENSEHDAVLALGHGDSITFAGVTAVQLDQVLNQVHLGFVISG